MRSSTVTALGLRTDGNETGLGMTYAVTSGGRRGNITHMIPGTPAQTMREYPNPTRANAPNPLTPVMTGSIGRGSLARALAGMFGAPGRAVSPTPTRAPETEMGDEGSVILDRNGNVIGYTRAMGDAMDDLQTDARRQAWAAAAGYKLPMVPTTRAMAIAEFVLIMRSAKQEAPHLNELFTRLEREAAYKYRDASVQQIVVDAAQVLTEKSTPRTRSIALDVVKGLKAAQAAQPAPAKAAPAKKRSRSSTAAEPDLAPVEAAADSPPWYASLPEWAPWAAGAVGVGVIALLAMPKRSPAA